MPDCPCVQMSRWLERDFVERSAKAARNVGDLWALKQGLKEIAEREIARLTRKQEALIAAPMRQSDSNQQPGNKQ